MVQCQCVNCPNKDLKRRLLEMGFCCSANVEVLHKTNNMICCKVRGYCLGLRKEEAECIEVSDESRTDV